MKLKNDTNHPGKSPAGTNPVAEVRQRKLKRHIRFTDDDLEANRRGTISDGGRRKLRWNLRWRIVSRSLLALVFNLPLLWFTGRFSWSSSSGWVLFIFALMGVGFCAWAAASIHMLWRKTRADLQQGKVSHVTGKISRYSYTPYRALFPAFRLYFDHHNDKIHSFSLDCSLWEYMAFADNAVYHVFYAPHTRTILSAEFVRDITHKIEKRYISGAD
jgi:hypothetical protein